MGKGEERPSPDLCNKASGRNKRAIEDRFDTNMELENILNARGKLRVADLV